VAVELSEWDTWGVVELPSGTVTFLFTDLEGSTRSWEENPDAMRVALARHDQILREAVDAEGGFVVKTTGDGLLAVFATADVGLRAAVAGQLALVREPWGVTAPFRVRMGLHSGAASYRDGDYFGASLNRAARLMSVAHGGQVVCSRATADLASELLPTGMVLLDLGEHRLRDLSRAERVYQVVVDGLERDFPPLRSLDAFVGNLPAQVTSFVGRVDDIASVVQMLKEARLVTLCGVGGVGKSRLAVHVAAEVMPGFPDGAWLCELAAAGDLESMLQVVATALGVRPRAQVALDVRLREALRDRWLLVILDNCEHLLDAASRLADGILRDCPKVRILATSREPLEIDGERVSRVRSLPVPDPQTLVERGDETDALRLFVERAKSAEREFRIGPGDASVIAEICRRLDGIPLAIELAATRVVSMSPAEILELLDERFRLLTGGRRTAVERHQTLRATVDWSYSLLGPMEQEVFDRLGVFPGSFDGAAARAVTAGDGAEDWDVLDALSGLVNKSMVTTVPAGAEATRYQLLETMRQFARERLDLAGDADHRRRAHAAYYAGFAERVSEAFATGVEADRMWARSELEVDNYRTAITWALDSDTPGDVDLALRIAGRFAALMPESRRAAGLLAHSDRLLEGAVGSSPALRAGILAGMSTDALYVHGDPAAAVDLARRAIADGPTAGGALAAAYTVLGMCAAIDGHYERAIEALREGQRRMKELGFKAVHTDAYFETIIATIEDARGDSASAQVHATEALELARRANLPVRLAQALITLARVSYRRDPAAALLALDEAASLPPEVLSPTLAAWMSSTRAHMCFAIGDSTGTLSALQEAVAASGDDANVIAVARTAALCATVFADIGEPTTAAVLAGAAVASHHGSLFLFLIDARTRAELDRTIERLRAALGADAYDTGARRGSEMETDELHRYLRRSIATALARTRD
jgi:predicted ATPase/class 3 adenylate cyclase